MDSNFKHSAPVDQVGIQERIARLVSRSLKKEAKTKALHLALSMIDLTTLEGKDTTGKIQQLCHKALHVCDDLPQLPNVAAVCVYAVHVAEAKRYLKGTQVKVAAVATGFPSGNSTLKAKIEETAFAIEQGADEIDMVISRGEFLKGNYNLVYDEISSIKEACGESRLKVILETGELSTLDNVRRASEIAIAAGADFIKTSTGKIQPSANLAVSLVMVEAIKDHYLKTNKMVGMKPAGGISTSKVALSYLVLLHEVLGNKWMTNEYFRFGASSLANDIVLQLGKEERGVYFSKDYLSVD